jgi:uncharacterized protein (UPF0332 family)
MKVWDYWQTDDLRKDQHFYIGFALFASAVNDYAVGRDLHLSKKLNWAASAYYYSMVHAGRLALFLVYGDFPTGHGPLASAFGDGVRGTRFWFTEFARGMTPAPDRSSPNDYKRQEIVSHYERLGMDRRETKRMFAQWTQALQQAKRLREDSNYESLLIAHEHNHVLVTQAFEKLCEVLHACAERVLMDTVQLFKTVITNSPRGKHWLAFLNHTTSPPDLNLEIHDREGLLYMEDSLQNILDHTQSTSSALSLLQPLRSSALANPLLADEVYRHIIIDAFGRKRNKMTKFRDKTLELDRTFRLALQDREPLSHPPDWSLPGDPIVGVFQQLEIWSDFDEGKVSSTLLDELLGQDKLIQITYGQAPFDVVLGVPHHAANGVSRIAERSDQPRVSDENAAMYALAALTYLRQHHISCRIVIAAHATDHDPNKEPWSSYCQHIFSETARMLVECHGCAENRRNDIEITAGSNKLTNPKAFGELLVVALDYGYRVGVQETPATRDALIFGPGARVPGSGQLRLPALETYTLRRAAELKMQAVHIEAKPRFRKASDGSNRATREGKELGQAIGRVIVEYLAR